MSKATRETVSDWLMAVAAPILFGSLFLTWSHQFSPGFLARWGHSAAVVGIPRDPTAWQVYSAADVMLAGVAAGLLAVALWGGRGRRLALALVLAVAVAFTVHALVVAPTNSVSIFEPAASPPGYAANAPSAGPGVIVALIALALGGAGIALSFTAD
ncbi:MAG: hypothetical protein WAL63_00560 [Solirubrobacteraceae bacterium]